MPASTRARYAGKYPRRFDEKYKEHNPEQYPETVRKVLDSGKTPAGAHVPILTAEILEAPDPQPGLDAATGDIAFLGATDAIANPSFLAVDPVGRYLFAVSETSEFEGKPSGSVHAFAGLRCTLTKLDLIYSSKL